MRMIKGTSNHLGHKLASGDTLKMGHRHKGYGYQKPRKLGQRRRKERQKEEGDLILNLSKAPGDGQKHRLRLWGGVKQRGNLERQRRKKEIETCVQHCPLSSRRLNDIQQPHAGFMRLCEPLHNSMRSMTRNLGDGIQLGCKKEEDRSSAGPGSVSGSVARNGGSGILSPDWPLGGESSPGEHSPYKTLGYPTTLHLPSSPHPLFFLPCYQRNFSKGPNSPLTFAFHPGQVPGSYQSPSRTSQTSLGTHYLCTAPEEIL